MWSWGARRRSFRGCQVIPEGSKHQRNDQIIPDSSIHQFQSAIFIGREKKKDRKKYALSSVWCNQIGYAGKLSYRKMFTNCLPIKWTIWPVYLLNRTKNVAEPNQMIPGQFHLSHYKHRRRSHRRKEVWTYLNAQSHLNWPQVRCFFFVLQNTSIRFSTRQNLLVEHQCTSVLLHGLVQHARSIIKRIHYSDRLDLSCTPLTPVPANWCINTSRPLIIFH